MSGHCCGRHVAGDGGHGPTCPEMARPFCGCCKRYVDQLDGLYGCCGACANCQSLTFGPDAPPDVECCHGLGTECCAYQKPKASICQDDETSSCGAHGILVQ